MPRPCAVETHARDYKKAVETRRDATALRRGDSRSRLQESCRNFPRCHGLAPWRFTFATTRKAVETLRDAMALRRGGSRSPLQEKL
jgi:nitroreductase